MSRSLLLLPLAVLALVALPLRAQTLTGQVVGPGGVGVGGVTLELSGGVSPANPVTAANGTFSIAVPAGTYDIDFLPPATNLAPVQLLNVSVSGTTNLGVIALTAGFVLTGTVMGPGGVLPGADINVYVQATGVKLFTPGDNTGLNGVFQVVVPAGTYRVRATPPAGVILVAQEVENVVVAGATSAGTIVLPPGVTLSGTVRNAQTLAPVAGVDVDVDDAITGARIVTPSDDTNASGVFSVIVPAGLHHVSFDPLPGVALVGRALFNVQVAGPATAMGFIGLTPGVFLSGVVTSPAGAPVAGADVDVDRTSNGERIYTQNDTTAANGSYAVVVPPNGTYQVKVTPLPSSGLVGGTITPVSVIGATTAPPLALAPGVTISGTVISWFGGPETGARLELTNPATGEDLITPGNAVGPNGQYAMVAPTGTWDLRVKAGRPSGSQDLVLPGFVVAGPMSFSPMLQLVPVATYMLSPGIPTVPQGGPLVFDLLIFNTTPAVQGTLVSLVLVDGLGNETTLLPPSFFGVPPQQLLVIPQVPLPLPPIPPLFLGTELDLEIRFASAATGTVFESDRVRFFVQ